MPAVKEEPTAKIKESFDDLHEIDASYEWEEVACKVIAIDCSNVHVFANALLDLKTEEKKGPSIQLFQ